MMSSADLRTRFSLSKAATIADWYYMHPILNTANWLTNETDLGTGVAAAASSMMLVLSGAPTDQKMTASMKITTGTMDLRIGVRVLTNLSQDSVNNPTYYWGGCTGTNFRIGKVVNGTFTTLATVAFTLASDTWCTFTLSAVGSTITGTYNDGTSSGSLTASDTDIPTGGVQMFRSGPTNSCNVYCRSWTVEEQP